MHVVKGPVLESMISKLALQKNTTADQLDPSQIQSSLRGGNHQASIFAIRSAQARLVQTQSSSQEEQGQKALRAQGSEVHNTPVSVAKTSTAKGTVFSALLMAKSSKDVVQMGPLPKLNPALLGQDVALKSVQPPVAPEIRSAQWGLDNVRSATKLSRNAYFEEAARGMGPTEPFAKARYGSKGAAMVVDMRLLNDELGPKVKGDFTQLLVDPGLMSPDHREAFSVFVTQNQDKLAGQTPFQMRQAYSDSLPPKTYYRAIKLPDSAAPVIAKDIGMTSRVARTLGNYPNVDQRISQQDPSVVDTRELANAPFAKALSEHIRPFSRVSKHRSWTSTPEPQRQEFRKGAALKLGLDVNSTAMKDKVAINKQASLDHTAARKADLERLKDGDAFLSVSEDKRVALSVAADPSMAGSIKPNESIYLYEIQLSPLDVINPEVYVGRDECPSSVSFGKGKSEPYTASIEGIVMPHIHSNEIKRCTKLDLDACKNYQMKLSWE